VSLFLTTLSFLTLWYGPSDSGYSAVGQKGSDDHNEQSSLQQGHFKMFCVGMDCLKILDFLYQKVGLRSWLTLGPSPDRKYILILLNLKRNLKK